MPITVLQLCVTASQRVSRLLMVLGSHHLHLEGVLRVPVVAALGLRQDSWQGPLAE